MLYKMTKPGMESVILLQTATASRSFEFARSVVTSRRYANRIFSLAALFGPPTMDIRILTLLVLISVAGSLADLRSPFVRTRRDGLQEIDKPPVVELMGVPRAKRESSTIESTTAKSTSNPITASRRSTSPATASSKKSPRSTPNSKPTTGSMPDASPTTTDSSPTTEPTPAPTTKRAPKPKPAPRRAARPTTTTTTTTAKPQTRPRTAAKPQTRPRAAAKPQTKPTTTAKPQTTPTTKPTTKKPSEAEKTTKPTSSTSPKIGSRFDPAEDEPQGSKEPQSKPQTQPNAQQQPPGANPSQPGFPYFPTVPLFYSPSYVPDFSPFVWPATNAGTGAASSYAGASAGGFGSPGYGYAPTFNDRGAFFDNVPSVSNVPDTANGAYSGAYDNNVGDNPFDPTNFSGGFGFDNIQKQMEENFRQLQAHLQKQQQAIFDTANRIGTDGSFGAGGGHSAVSSINLGPDGGYQAGAINPVAPGVVSRFGEELPPPSGNSYGVFAGSSSHTVIGPDGKPVSHKVSTTGVNDNGKITFRTVED